MERARERRGAALRLQAQQRRRAKAREDARIRLAEYEARAKRKAAEEERARREAALANALAAAEAGEAASQARARLAAAWLADERRVAQEAQYARKGSNPGLALCSDLSSVRALAWTGCFVSRPPPAARWRSSHRRTWGIIPA